MASGTSRIPTWIFRRNLCAPEELPEVDRRSKAELDARSEMVPDIKISEIVRATAIDVHRPEPERLTV